MEYNNCYSSCLKIQNKQFCNKIISCDDMMRFNILIKLIDKNSQYATAAQRKMMRWVLWYEIRGLVRQIKLTISPKPSNWSLLPGKAPSIFAAFSLPPKMTQRMQTYGIKNSKKRNANFKVAPTTWPGMVAKNYNAKYQRQQMYIRWTKC